MLLRRVSRGDRKRTESYAVRRETGNE
jgi:hypothetical protein